MTVSNLILSPKVTVSKKEDSWVIFNWDNNQYAEIFDKSHPLFDYFDNNHNNNKVWNTLEKEDFDWLIENKFLIPTSSSINEKVEDLISHTSPEEHLKLILLPAGELCNFGCVYCYQDNVKTKMMDEESSETLLSFIGNINPQKLSIEYFGGEPLLNKQFIFTFNKALMEYYARHSDNFQSSMTTNGYLLNLDLFQQLYFHKVTSYQITLDGHEDFHNSTRPLRNGKGTFSTIMENLIQISKLDNTFDFNITIRINFNEQEDSKDKMILFLEQIKNLFGHNERFSFRFRPIGNYASANNKLLEGAQYCSKSSSVELRNEFEKLATKYGIRLADYVKEQLNSICYAGEPNSLVVLPDLAVMKCTVALTNPINKVGEISSQGELHKNPNWDLWIKGTDNLSETCKGCFYVAKCSGNSCPLENILHQSTICPPTKKNYAHVAATIIEQEAIEAGA